MAVYDANISRGTGRSTFATSADGVSPLIPEDVSREIVKNAVQKSCTLSLFKKRPMSTAQQRMPVLATKPTAYFVTGDTGLKQTTNMSWKNKYLDAEEIAVIVPVPEKVLDDVDYDLWAEIKPEIEEAIAVALDAAILFGTNIPSSWPDAVSQQAITVANTTSTGAGADIGVDINTVMGQVEADGYEVNGFVMRNSLKATLRGLRTREYDGSGMEASGPFLFLQGMPGLENAVYKGSIYGEKVLVPTHGVFEGQVAATLYGGGNVVNLIAGDWSQGIIGVRQDMTWKLLDQAVLQDENGAIQYNLPQQDMVAMRVVCRYAWQVPNPYNRLNTQETASPASGDRYPFAVLRA